jgi:predicted DNA-binding transcriptional regulator AlpA
MHLVLILAHLQFERLSSITHHLRKKYYQTNLTARSGLSNFSLTTISLSTFYKVISDDIQSLSIPRLLRSLLLLLHPITILRSLEEAFPTVKSAPDEAQFINAEEAIQRVQEHGAWNSRRVSFDSLPFQQVHQLRTRVLALTCKALLQLCHLGRPSLFRYA